MNSITKAFRAGQVTRYSPRPEVNKLGQTTADHTAGMLALLFALNPDPSVHLVRAIVEHDQPELFGGDLPYDFKKAYPTIAKHHDNASFEMAGMRKIQLTEVQQKWLTMLDMLEPYLYIQTYVPALLEDESWQQLKHAVIDIAKSLGVYEGDLADAVPDDRGPEKNSTTHDTRIDLLSLILSDDILMRALEAQAEQSTTVRETLVATRNNVQGLVNFEERLQEPSFKIQAVAGDASSEMELNPVTDAAGSDFMTRLARQTKSEEARLHREKPATRAELLQAALGEVDAGALGQRIKGQLSLRDTAPGEIGRPARNVRGVKLI